MNLKYFSLCLIIIFSFANSINPLSFCKITKKNCTGKYDKSLKYSQKCVLINKCPVNFKYKCTSVFCSNKKINCNLFYDVNFIFFRNQFDKILHKKGEKIKCNFSTDHNSLSSADICLKGKKITKTFRQKNKNNRIVNRLPCPRNQSYECGSTYCSSDSIACETFVSRKWNASLGFGKCLI